MEVLQAAKCKWLMALKPIHISLAQIIGFASLAAFINRQLNSRRTQWKEAADWLALHADRNNKNMGIFFRMLTKPFMNAQVCRRSMHKTSPTLLFWSRVKQMRNQPYQSHSNVQHEQCPYECASNLKSKFIFITSQGITPPQQRKRDNRASYKTGIWVCNSRTQKNELFKDAQAIPYLNN